MTAKKLYEEEQEFLAKAISESQAQDDAQKRLEEQEEEMIRKVMEMSQKEEDERVKKKAGPPVQAQLSPQDALPQQEKPKEEVKVAAPVEQTQVPPIVDSQPVQ